MKKVYLIAIIVALFAGLATYMFATSLNEKTDIDNAPVTKVLQAVVDVPAGTVITAENQEQYFRMTTVVKDALAPGAVTNFNAIENLMTTQTIFLGEQVSINAFKGDEVEDVDGLSFEIPDNMVAYSISAAAQVGVDARIEVGDTVNIMAAYVFPDDLVEKRKDMTSVEYYQREKEVFGVMEDVEVIALTTPEIERTSEMDGTFLTYASITLLVTKDQAKELYAMEVQAEQFKMTLNPRRVEAPEETEQAE